MEEIVGLGLVAGILLAGALTWGLARHCGPVFGLAVSVLAAVAMYYRIATGSDHPEALMGNEMELLFVWFPVIGLSAACCAAGLVGWWLARRGPPQ